MPIMICATCHLPVEDSWHKFKEQGAVCECVKDLKLRDVLLQQHKNKTR